MAYAVRAILLVLGAATAASALAQPYWVTHLPELPAACDTATVSPDDEAGLFERLAALQAELPSGNTADVALFVRPSSDDAGKIVACALNPGPGGEIRHETLPPGPALIAYCAAAESEVCHAAIGAVVGDGWRGIRWAVPHMAWVEDGTPPPVAGLGREASELLALGVQPLRISPSATASLQAVGEVHVLRLTDEQAAALVATAAPAPEPPPAVNADGAPEVAPPPNAAPVVTRVDALQSYLECNNAAVPDAYGVLSDPGARVVETIDRGEQEGGWRLAIAPARQVFGYEITEVTAYVGERNNYRTMEIAAAAAAVRDQISATLNEGWKEATVSEGALSQEDGGPETPTYHFARRDLSVIPKAPDLALVICQGDAGSGFSDADLDQQERQNANTEN
jgi:hypothetical protein